MAKSKAERTAAKATYLIATLSPYQLLEAYEAAIRGGKRNRSLARVDLPLAELLYPEIIKHYPGLK